MSLVSALADCWLGLCRKAPVVHCAPVVIMGDAGTSHANQPDAGGSAGRAGRIQHGVSLAAESIRAPFRDTYLLGFSVLAAIIILFVVLAERWNLTHLDPSYAPLNLITMQMGNTYLVVFDLRLFLIEAMCLSGFTFLLAALVRYRSHKKKAIPITLRSAFRIPHRQAMTLAALSLAMALAATVLLEIAAQNYVTGSVESAITHTMFWLPYAYYFAPNGIFTTLFFSFRMMGANAVMFLLALYGIPVIVLENKGFFRAIAGSFSLVKKTGREVLGCTLVFGAIILAVALIGLVIGQSPALLNNDYDFFLQVSRGQVLMMAACYGFLLACGVLMALGSTILGVAVTDLYGSGTMAGKHTVMETCGPAGGVVVR